MSEPQDFRLRWSSYTQQLSEALRNLLDRELLVDVTLACDGRSLRAHRAVLSACSSYFQDLFQESTHPHPIVILKDVRYQELEALVKFMYHGEVTVNHDTLPGFLRTAETLHVRGLTDSAVPGSSSAAVPEKLTNSQRRREDEGDRLDTLETDNVESASGHVLSPLPLKRIKIEQSGSSQYSHPTRIPQLHQEVDESYDGNSLEDKNMTEQDSHCTLRPDELSHINQDHFNVQRSSTSLDGLSQLVMPILQDENSCSSQYVGVCQNIPNQHHHVSQQQQAIQHHQQGQQNVGAAVSASSRPFRQRVLYNQEQLLQLEAWYRHDRYPSGTLMREYADTLAAMVPNTPGSIGAQPMRQNVDYWFQNRRRKDFHPEVMQQREKKKLAKTLWGSYNGNAAPVPSSSNAASSGTQSESNGSNR